MSRRPTTESVRRRERSKVWTLRAIVRSYRVYDRPRAIEEAESFRNERTVRGAVRRAALAQRPDGKRYEHQRRLSRTTLHRVRRVLLPVPLQRCRSFDELHSAIERAVSQIRGVGELMVYDTAVRIGARLGLCPAHVYMHAGTRAGARALGLDWRSRVLEVVAVPVPLQTLEPFEIEDCLCIYADRFPRRMRRTRESSRQRGGAGYLSVAKRSAARARMELARRWVAVPSIGERRA